jgi:hypothetical protein
VKSKSASIVCEIALYLLLFNEPQSADKTKKTFHLKVKGADAHRAPELAFE